MKLISHGSNQTEIQLNDGSTLFFSYGTLVMVKTKDGERCQTMTRYSPTTQRHINRTIERWGEVDRMVLQKDLEEMVKIGEI